MNSDTRRRFVVAQDTFTRMGFYRFRLQLYSAEFDTIKVYETTKTFKMADGPYAGRLTVDRQEGAALVYQFTIRADGWKSHVDPPNLTYQYFYRKPDRSLGVLSEPAQDLTLFKTVLPETGLLYVWVTDALGGTTERGLPVAVSASADAVDAKSVQDSAKRQEQLIKEGKTVEGFNELAAWSAALEKFQAELSKEELRQAGAEGLRLVELGIESKAKLEPQQQEFVT